VIRSFRDKHTEDLWITGHSRRLHAIARVAYKRLVLLHRSTSLEDLRRNPGNHLEALVGDRMGQWSIRVNRQFRICFKWHAGDAFEVEIVDYH
jgi:toxin HigB-1